MLSSKKRKSIFKGIISKTEIYGTVFEINLLLLCSLSHIYFLLPTLRREKSKRFFMVLE